MGEQLISMDRTHWQFCVIFGAIQLDTIAKTIGDMSYLFSDRYCDFPLKIAVVIREVIAIAGNFLRKSRASHATHPCVFNLRTLNYQTIVEEWKGTLTESDWTERLFNRDSRQHYPIISPGISVVRISVQ